ncbi:hypothetical protein ACXZ9C_11185 [Streptococcus agalactiae]
MAGQRRVVASRRRSWRWSLGSSSSRGVASRGSSASSSVAVVTSRGIVSSQWLRRVAHSARVT